MRANQWQALKMAGIARQQVTGTASKATPWNPDMQAILRIRNAPTVPKCCPNCDSTVEFVNNQVIYGYECGEYPYALRCVNPQCNSYIGLHPKTNIPLGTLANDEQRRYRKQAKEAFDRLWKRGPMNYTQAAAWLAGKLEIQNVQISMFDKDMCRRVVSACHEYREAA